MFFARSTKQERVTNREGETMIKRAGWGLIPNVLTIVLGVTVVFSEARADSIEHPNSVVDFDLEELMDLEAYSVSKKMERLQESGAAVYVLSSEDIKSIGARSLPELLRRVPGLHIAQFNANSWSVSSRGFTGRFANKLLVLLDGRSLYTPVFSGVYWEEQDTLLDDIERIEVIRGPGGTLWGANAVNGVINIVTKKAANTKGTYISGGGGTEQRHFSGARIGGALNDNTDLRVYAKHYNRDANRDLEGGAGPDASHAFFSGFRLDWAGSESDSITFQGDVYDGSSGQKYFIPTEEAPFQRAQLHDDKFHGANVLGRWNKNLSKTSDLQVQLYFDRSERNSALNDYVVDTYDAEFQHSFQMIDSMNFIWGGGYRGIEDEIVTDQFVHYDPTNRNVKVLSAFGQADIKLIPEVLSLVMGTKLEHNDYTGGEFQPNARLIWVPSSTDTVWAAFSRAVRTPSRVDDDIEGDLATTPVPGVGLVTTRIIGNDNFDAENLHAYEVGYRTLIANTVKVDLTGFVFDYGNLSSVESVGTDFQNGRILNLVQFDNTRSGQTVGGEVTVSFDPTPWWRLQSSYSYAKIDLKIDPTNTDPFGRANAEEDQYPENQATLWSRWKIGSDWNIDAFLRYVDRLSDPDIDAYMELDLKLGYQVSPELEFAILGHDLLHDEHPEFGEGFFAPSTANLQRGVFAQVTWRP